MDENQYIEQRTDEEIDLRELFLVIWKKKLFIISITLIATILAGIISVFVLSPVYHSRLNIIINMPETYHTKYGDYILPITSNDQYVRLITSSDIMARTIDDMGYDSDNTIEAIRERITVDIPDAKPNTIQNSFTVKVAADNPAEAKKLAQTLFDNYIKFLDLMVVEGALDSYINRFNVELSSLEVSLTSTKEILAKNEALLASTPQTINQKAALDEISNSNNTNDYIILENVINPNYTKIEEDIIANKQLIDNIENTMRVYNEHLTELNLIKDDIASYQEDGNFAVIEEKIVSVTKTNVYLPSEPIEPSQKTSPSNVKNVLIGAVLGGMIAVFITLIREYWLKSQPEPKKKTNK